jgi:mono/diheme cytochrome c family protein
MSRSTTFVALAVSIFLTAAASAQRQTTPGRPGQVEPLVASSGPDAREATARRLCATCHPFENIIAIRRTHAQWQATVENMVSRGARGTNEEFASVVAFLSEKYGLTSAANRGDMGMGPDDKPIVDPKAVDIAKPLWASDCQTCHGQDARGSARGPNLVRSTLVLSDRYGSAIGPFLRTKHPALPSGKKIELTDTQVLLFAHFLRDRVNDTLRGSPSFKPGDILVGNARAGADYFNGEGRCSTCHSTTGDLKGIASRMDPVGIQQRLLFPQNAMRRGTARGPVPTVTVTQPSGEKLEGELVYMDDFNLSLRDASGGYHSVRRAAGVKVEKHDPYAAHVELLSKITDAQIHDLVAYLETLK